MACLKWYSIVCGWVVVDVFEVVVEFFEVVVDGCRSFLLLVTTTMQWS